MIIAAFAAGLLVAQAAAQAPPPASAQPAATAEAPAAKAEKPEKPKMICTKEQAIGSNMPRRVCRTPDRIEAEQRAADRVGVYLQDQR